MINYILYSGVLISIFWLFYKALLARQTFFSLNRFFLVCGIILSLTLPLVPVPSGWLWHHRSNLITISALPETNAPVNINEPGSKKQTQLGQPESEKSGAETKPKLNLTSAWNIVSGIYLSGIFIMLASLIFQFYKLKVKSKHSISYRDGRYRIYEVPDNAPACSFAANIFINPDKYDAETYEQVLLHEKIHARQLHTVDVLLSELFIIFQWFNPFAWLYRKAVENNLEFLTDDLMLEQDNVHNEEYQMALLRVSVPSMPLAITSNYNQSLLKTRINMMNAKRSSGHSIWKYFFAFPVIFLAICTFSRPMAISQRQSANLISPATGTANPVVTFSGDVTTEGVWLGIFKGDSISIDIKSSSGTRTAISTLLTSNEVSGFKQKEATGGFNIVRDAGTIFFKGTFSSTEGSGHYSFQGNPGFAEFLKKEGIKDVTENVLFKFCFANVSRQFISDLLTYVQNKTIEEQAEGIPADRVVQLRVVGADKSYMEDLRNAGCSGVKIEELVMLKMSGVEPGFIKEIKSLGYAELAAEKFIALKGAGITPGFITGFQKQGFVNIPLEVLMMCRMKDVTPEFVTEMKKKGVEFKNIEQYIPLKK